MNILFLDQFSDLGGAQKCLLDLLPGVHERGWQAHIAAPGCGPLMEKLQLHAATVDTLAYGPYHSGRKTIGDHLRFAYDLPRLAARIRSLIDQYQARLVYVNGPRVLPAAAWAARNRASVLFHCHSYLTGRDARLAGRAVQYANALVVASCSFVLQPLRRFLGGRQSRVIYNGVAGSHLSRSPAITGQWSIGTIGRVAPEKGQARFIQAARLLAGDSCRFVICGAPLFSDPAAAAYFDSLVTMASGLPIEFVGWRDDVYEVLAQLDLLVVPSGPEEATPRVILESYAAGVPVVAFRSGGIPEIVSHGETGILVESLDPEPLAQAIRDLLHSPGNLDRIRENARAAWREKFTVARYQREILDAIEDLILF